VASLKLRTAQVAECFMLVYLSLGWKSQL